jgi:putative flippase GtrA
LSDFYVPAPPVPGLYYFEWPTNVYIPPQFSNYGLYYYHILVEPAVGDELNVAYTTSTSTNYSYNNAWTFYPEASVINGSNEYYSLVNIYATVLPPPVLYPIHLRDVAVLPDDSFQFGFTNTPSLSFSVYLTTNLALPFTNWIYSGPANNIASNYFQYNTGPDVVHNPAYPSTIFFHVTSP